MIIAPPPSPGPGPPCDRLKYSRQRSASAGRLCRVGPQALVRPYRSLSHEEACADGYRI